MKTIWKNGWKRLLALVLCLATILPMVPQMALFASAAAGQVLADGVVDRGGTNTNNAVTVTNKQPYYRHVENATSRDSNGNVSFVKNMLKAGERYIIMNEGTGDILSYNPVAVVEGFANLPTSLHKVDGGTGYKVKLEYTGTDPGKFSVKGRPKEIYVDNSERNNVEWIFGPLQGSVNEEPVEGKHTAAYLKDKTTGDYASKIANKDIYDPIFQPYAEKNAINTYKEGNYYAYFGRRLRCWTGELAGNVTGEVGNGWGFEFYKGRQGEDKDHSYTGGDSHATHTQGYYWDVPVVGGSNTAEVDNQKYFPYLNFRSTDNAFANEELWAAQKKLSTTDSGTGRARANYKLAFFDTGANMKFAIYFRMRQGAAGSEWPADYRMLIQDEDGNWGVRQYHIDPSNDPYVHNIGEELEADLLNIQMRLYLYVGEETKSVQLSGSKDFTVATGTPVETVAEGLMKSVVVTDTKTQLSVAGTGHVAMRGRYFFASSISNTNGTATATFTPVSNDTFATAGTKTVYVCYYNDNGTAQSLGTINVVVEGVQGLSGLTDLYVSQHARIGDPVYTKSGSTYTQLMMTLGRVEIPVTIKDLLQNGQMIPTDNSVVLEGVTLHYAGQDRATGLKVHIVPETINSHLLTENDPGYVWASKTGDPESGTTLTKNNKQVKVTLSAKGNPYERGIDLVVVMDLSPTMRKYVTDSNTEAPVYYDFGHAFNTGVILGDENKWTIDKYRNTRLFAMEESLDKMIETLQKSGKSVRIAIADCGDLDYYHIGGSVNNEQSGSILVTDDSRNHGKWPYLETDSQVTADTAWNRAEELPNHLNYVFGSSDTTSAGAYELYDWKYWSVVNLQEKKYYKIVPDANGVNQRKKLDAEMSGFKESKVYTGFQGYNIHGFVDINSIGENTMKEYVHDFRVRNSYMLGSNYDAGLETAYHLAKAAQEDNIKKGADRDVICIFMSDGGVAQYNYFSGQKDNQSWADWVTGAKDSVEHNYSFPTTEDGHIKVSEITKMPPMLQELIRACGHDEDDWTYWSNLFADIKADNGWLPTGTINGKTYTDGSTLLQDLIKELGTPKEADTLETYSPFYYFYNKEGKNWWAEAIKGNRGELYPVINKYAHWDQETDDQKAYFEKLGRGGGTDDSSSPFDYNGEDEFEHNFAGNAANGNHTAGLELNGKNYISGFDGLGIDLYTLGFDIEDDGALTADVQKAVLRNIASDSTYFREAVDKDTMTEELNHIIDNLTKGPTRAYLTDVIGDGFDLVNNSVISITGDDVEPRYYKININNKTAYACDADGNVSGDDLWTADNKNNLVDMGSLMLFNANSAHTSLDLNNNGTFSLDEGDVVNGQLKIDMTGDGVLDNFVIQPESFFWRIGAIPANDIKLSFTVDLTDYDDGPYVNNDGTVYANKGKAVLSYKDLQGNDQQKLLDPLVYNITSKSTYTNVAFYVEGTTTILAGSSRQVNLPGNTTVHLTAQDYWNQVCNSTNQYNLKYQLVDSTTEAVIASDSHKQNHNITIDTDAKTKWCTTGSLATAADSTDVQNSVLEGSTVYFAVKPQTSTTTYNYAFYLADSNGNPIGGGKPSADRIGDIKTGNSVTVSGSDVNKTTSVAIGTAFTERGLNSAYYSYDSNDTFTITSNIGSNHVLTLNGTMAMSGDNVVASGSDYSNDALKNVTIYFPVTKNPDKPASIKYVYYRVDKDGTPLNENGEKVGILSAHTMNGDTVKFDIINKTDATLTPFTATAPAGYTLKDGTNPFSVSSVYASATHTLTLSGDHVYYQVGTGTPDKNPPAGVDSNTLATYTVWIPVQKTHNYTIKVTENYVFGSETVGTYNWPDQTGIAEDKTISGNADITKLSDENKGRYSLTGATWFEVTFNCESATTTTKDGSATVNVTVDETTKTVTYTVTYNVTKDDNKPASIKYVYYRVDKYGNPLDVDGNGVAIGSAHTMNGGTHDFDIVNKTDATVTPFTATAPAGYALKHDANPFTVYSVFVGGTHTLTLNGDYVYYQEGKGTPTQEIIPNVSTETLANYTVWIPVYKNTSYTIKIKETYKYGNETVGTYNWEDMPDITADRHITGKADINRLDDANKGQYSLTGETAFDVTFNYETATTTQNSGATVTATVDKDTNTVIYEVVYNVAKVNDKPAFINYLYYRVDKNGNPLDENGNGVAIGSAHTMNGGTHNFAIVNKTDATVTSITATAPAGYALKHDANPFTVNSVFVNATHTLTLNGEYVYYQVDDGTPTREITPNVSTATLATYTVWIPVYKNVNHNIIVQENFYLVDKNGEPLKGFTGLLDPSASSEIEITDDKSIDIDGKKTFNDSSLDKDLFELVGEPGATINPSYETKLNEIIAEGDHTQIVKDNEGKTSVPDVPADEVKDYVIFYAVVLKDLAAEDTIVVDFGLPVNIDVLTNDAAPLNNGTLTYVNKDWSDSYASGKAPSTYTGFDTSASDTNGKASISGKNVLYTPSTIAWNGFDSFAYAAKITVTNAGELYYYGKVNVIPATSIYYEDNAQDAAGNALITYNTYDVNGSNWTAHTTSKWTDVGTVGLTEQDKDLKGDQSIYGYDSHYENCLTYSMGSAKQVTVQKGMVATATFTFYGTGFDVISKTANDCGYVMYKVVDESNTTVKNTLVDTYYTSADGIYQVPVIKLTGLTFGKYTVTLSVNFMAMGNHKDDTEYSFYLDAIRIYDPANDGNGNDTIKNTYTADAEGWPEYFELRNQILSTDDLDNSDSGSTVAGVVFIDGSSDGGTLSVTDYKNFGPNNEVYLAHGQSVAFYLDVKAPTNSNIASIQIGLKSANGKQVTAKYFNLTSTDAGSVSVSNINSTSINTATEMYYSLATTDGDGTKNPVGMNNKVMVISNTSADTTAILSITNIKITYTAAHTDSIENDLFGKMKVSDMVENLGEVIGGETSDGKPSDSTGKVQFTGASVSLKDEVFVNFNMTITNPNMDGSKATNAGLLLWDRQPVERNQDGSTKKVDGKVVWKANYDDAQTIISGALKSGGKYVVQTEGIAAKKLGDTIYARAYYRNADGTYNYSSVVEYSPKQYCYNMLKKDISDDLKGLLVAMLNYGTEAQKYFDYNVDIWMPLPNANLTDAQKAYALDYSKIGTVDGPKKTKVTGWSGTYDSAATIAPSVSFDGALSINYYMTLGKAVKEATNVTFYYWTENTFSGTGTPDLAKASGKMTIINAGQTQFKASVTDIVARNINDPVYVAAVYTGADGNTYYTDLYTYSIRNYCDSKANDAEMGEFAKATAVYGYYAKKVLGN